MMDEFFTGFFGPAAEPMRSFYTLLESRWIETKLPTDGLVNESPANVWLHIYSPPVVEELLQYLETAAELAGNGVYRQRITRLADEFEVVREKSRQWAVTKAADSGGEIAGNVIGNGGFELAAENGRLEGKWGSMNNRMKEQPEVFLVSDEQVHSGRFAFCINQTDHAENVASLSYTIAPSVEEYQKFLGKHLKLTYWVYHEQGELTLTTHVRLFQQKPGKSREYCTTIISVRSVPVTQGVWTKVERMGVVPYYENIVAMDMTLGARHSGSDPPVVYFDDFSLTPISRGQGLACVLYLFLDWSDRLSHNSRLHNVVEHGRRG